MSLHWSLRLLCALASGILLGFGFAPYHALLAPWLPLAVLVMLSLGARRWLALLCGFLHGVAFYTTTLPWIYTVMRVHGDLPPVQAAGVVALLVAYLALFPALFSLGVAYAGRVSAARACFAAPFLWVAVEFLRAHMPILGFPWNLLGYALWKYLGLMQVAALSGVYGVSFIVAAWNALLAWLLLTRRHRAWPLALVLLGLPFLVEWGSAKLVPQAQPRRTAHLVQTNFPQEPSYSGDWLEQHAAELDELENLSVAAGQRVLGLVVWPEVPVPLFSMQYDAFAQRARRLAQGSGGYFLTGVVDWRRGPDGSPVPYNSATLLDPQGRQVFLYDKIHLVPFGEYVPLRRWLGFARALTADVGNFGAGSEYKVGELPDGKFGVLICFEAVFPAEVRRFTVGGAGLLINISNDGWFGRSFAPEQHLEISRVRAVENRCWLLRATNNGHTVVVDPYGRIAARMEPDRRGVLYAPYDFRSDRTLYSRLGDWLAWVCVIVALATLAASRRRGKEGSKEVRR